MSDKIRIAIADDHALFRRGVRQTLEDADLIVAGEAGTAEEALALAREKLPDLLLLDVSMPGRSGLDILTELKKDVPVCRVIILTVSEDEDSVFSALRQGAHGYVVKGAKSSELLAAIKAVDAGETYISPGVAGRILAEMADGQVIGNAPDLSEREQEILNRIAEGETNKEIAAALFLSEKTIKHYVTNVLTKLHVRNRVEAALKARSLRTP